MRLADGRGAGNWNRFDDVWGLLGALYAALQPAGGTLLVGELVEQDSVGIVAPRRAAAVDTLTHLDHDGVAVALGAIDELVRRLTVVAQGLPVQAAILVGAGLDVWTFQTQHHIAEAGAALRLTATDLDQQLSSDSTVARSGSRPPNSPSVTPATRLSIWKVRSSARNSSPLSVDPENE